MSQAIIIRGAGALGLVGVGAGSYGAHMLEAGWQQRRLELDDDSIARWKHVYHTGWIMNMSGSAATLGVAALSQQLKRPTVVAALIGGGTLLFSSSAYIAAYTTNRKYSMGAPVGGTLTILGWLMLMIFP